MKKYIGSLFMFAYSVLVISASPVSQNQKNDKNTGNQTFFNVEKVPEKQDEICFEPKVTGPCRARLIRYYYNKSAQKCLKFMYGGCLGNGNRFKTLEECETSCNRNQNVVEARNERTQTCMLDVDMLDQCKVTSSLQDMTLCGAVPLTTNKPNCVANNCCWHPIFKICHASVAQRITDNRCKILYGDYNGFIGMATFQSNGDYMHGWNGRLHFTNKVTGNFCLLENTFLKNTIQSVNKLEEGELVSLSSELAIYGGQNVAVVFAGSYGDTKISNNICQEII